MKIYTVIVTYNGLKWIDKTIQSVIASSSIVIVDNNSKDKTVEFVRKKYPSVKIHEEKENHGFGVANNIGISYALKNNADAVFLLNQDAYAEENCIDELKVSALKNKNYGIISPIHLNGNGDEVDYSFMKVTSPFRAGKLISDLILNSFSQDIYSINFINAAAWFIPREVFLKIGGFDPLFFLYGEDDNYCQRVLYHGFKIGIVPNTKIFHDSLNNSAKINKVGSPKYYNQFKNKTLVKFANVNTENFKKIRSYKLYILKKAIAKILRFDFSNANVLMKKYKLINEDSICQSVLKNRQLAPNHLNM